MSFEEEYKSKLMSPQEAVAEASRCLGCDDAPCQKGCPAANDVVKFIRQIAQRNFRGAIKTVREANVLAGTCALICPVGDLCEYKCEAKLERPVAIGALQRFVAEYERTNGMTMPPSDEPKNKSIGIIGSGPAGLSAAFYLAQKGYEVEIYEADELPGGILTYGIPSYRLDPNMVHDEIEYIKAAGVKINTNSPIIDIADFISKHDSVFIGVGAYRPLKLKIENENLTGIFQAAVYLKDRKIAKLFDKPPMITLGKEVVVIGGGNTAIDAALSARFSGSQVTVYYRRRSEDMPAFKSEVFSAEKYGVKFKFNYSPLEFRKIGDKIEILFCGNKMGNNDSSGRPTPEPIDGSEENIIVDNVLIAVGQGPTYENTDLVKSDKKGLLIVDSETCETSMAGLFAGGDAINGGATAVQAIADGKRAAYGIDLYLQRKEN